MKLRSFLKSVMTPYANRVAFENSGITYSDLLKLFDNEKKGGKLKLCEGKTKEEQALNILKCIAEGNIAVPVSEEYGNEQYAYVKNLVCKDTATHKDFAFLIFTSGTTGKPKGVMLTDENVIINIGYITEYFNVTNCNKICIARPLLHIAVLTGELLFALCNGLTVTFFEEGFMPQRLLRFLSDTKTDVFCATPTLFITLARYAGKVKTNLKVCAISGERLTKNGAETIVFAFPDTAFYNVYGLTEHSPRVSALGPSDFLRKAGSVGKPIGCINVKTDDGELLVSSLCIMKGYYCDKRKTKQKIQDGWLRTGDIAHFDDEGFLYIDGRKDNMIIRSGINVYPESIEDVAMKIPEVEDCVVIGKTDDKGVTKIILKYTGNAEPYFLRKQLSMFLDTHLMPDRIENVSEIMKTASGKRVRK